MQQCCLKNVALEQPSAAYYFTPLFFTRDLPLSFSSRSILTSAPFPILCSRCGRGASEQVTAFVALLTLDAKRQEAGRYNCFCCFTSETFLQKVQMLQGSARLSRIFRRFCRQRYSGGCSQISTFSGTTLQLALVNADILGGGMVTYFRHTEKRSLKSSFQPQTLL